METAITNILNRLFERHFGSPVTRVQPLQGELGGSGRQIIRISGATNTAIGIVYGVREENAAFLEFSRHFRRHGLPVPKIYGEDLDHGAYLEEDLGDTTLFEFLSKNRNGETIAQPVVEAYRKAVGGAAALSGGSGARSELQSLLSARSFDRQSIAWDLNYFKYYFLRLAGVPFNEQALEDDFGRLTRFSAERGSANIFCIAIFSRATSCCATGSRIFWTIRAAARARCSTTSLHCCLTPRPILPPELRRQLLEHYLDALAGYIKLDREAFLQHYYAYVYVRIMQALGAYGFRGFYERKPHFLQSVPYALKNVRWLLHNVTLPMKLPTLMAAFTGMLASEKIAGTGRREAENIALRVFQFFVSPRMPKDETGNGGGFVFDARSLPNPGREERFKPLTGKDAPVIEYLNQQESVHQFLDSVMALVDASVR